MDVTFCVLALPLVLRLPVMLNILNVTKDVMGFMTNANLFQKTCRGADCLRHLLQV